MVSSTSSLFYSFVGDMYSRRLLLLHSPPSTAADSPVSGMMASQESPPAVLNKNSRDTNIVMILSILLCALICVLVINSIVRCVLRCLSRASVESRQRAAASKNGINKKALKTFPTLTYSTGLNMHGCTICLSEFTPGQRLRVLPKCDHGFHLRCIDKWLMSHSSCPNCRQCLIDTCQKIVRGNEDLGQLELLPVILPLAREGLIVNYASVC